MAENEYCKVSEVATIEENFESGTSSYQDPSTPDHNGPSHNNQTNGLQNSYVADNSSVSPESVTPVDDHGIEIDSQNELGVEDLKVSKSPIGIVMVDDQGIETDSQNELGVEDMKVSKSPMGIVMVGQVLCLTSQKPTKHTSYLEDVDKLLIPIANSLENTYVNNDDESRILLDKEDVEDTGDQFDTATHCCTEHSFQTENEQTENDDAVCNKNIDQGIELDSQNERLDVVDGEGSEPLNVEENRKEMGLDYPESFPPLISQNRRKITSDVAVMFGTTISYNSDVNDNDDELKTENEQTGNCDRKGKSVASSEGCSIEAVKNPLNFLVKIPRFDDEVLREQIRLSKLHVVEKAGLRDSILVLIKEKRANNQIHGLNYETAKTEVRCARNLMKSKYMEIDSLQSVINRARTALCIEDINSQISNMDYRMQHNSITLKEEKQLLQEIKKLKQAREQMTSNIGSQNENKQAVQQREEAEERLKTLRKDLNILKTGVSKAEATATEAMKKYHDEKQTLMKLEAQFRAADKVQQEAYKKLRILREELSKKEEHFFKYKKDAGVANNYALNKDTMALHSFCSNHVENFMNLWNKNEEYRREYARNNARSTVRRFGTLDGRALGHGEKPPILPNMISRVVSAPVKAVPARQTLSVEVKQETTNGNMNLGGKSTNEVTKSKNILKDEFESLRKEEQVKMERDEAKLKEQHRAEEMAKANEAFKMKKTVKADLASQILSVKVKQKTKNNVTLSGLSINEATESKNISKRTKTDADEEPVESKDEVESLRKEEEVTDEAKLKELRRAEEMAKADEAFKRKKREEKKQRREELKARKEAEEREKRREKRRRKKERKEAGSVHSNEESSAVCEDAEDIQVKEMPPVAPQKPCSDAKKCKAKPIPAVLLRRRKRRDVRQWMWVGITSFIFLVLFLVGEYRRIPMQTS